MKPQKIPRTHREKVLAAVMANSARTKAPMTDMTSKSLTERIIAIAVKEAFTAARKSVSFFLDEVVIV